MRALTLDSLVRDDKIDPARVGLLWIDVQRHEGRALKGGGLLLDAGVPVVVATRPEPKEDRPVEDWIETKRLLGEAFADYTEFLMLRSGSREPHERPGRVARLADRRRRPARDQVERS